MFYETQSGQYRARTLCLDIDESSVEQLKKGWSRQLYNPNYLISCKESTGGLYSRGLKLGQKGFSEQCIDKFRLLLQNCDHYQGLILNNAMTGGTSGLFTDLTSKLMGQSIIVKKPKISMTLFPTQHYTSILDSYNFTLGYKSMLQYIDLGVVYDNQSLYKICEEMNIENVGFSQINQIIAQMQSSVTLNMRSKGELNCRMNDLLTNLIAYPRIHSVYSSIATL